MNSHQHKIYLMKDYEQFRKHSSTDKSRKLVRNNVCPLNVNKNTAKDRHDATKSFFVYVMVICIWCFAMCLLAKVTYPFLQAICINSVQQLNLSKK